MDASGNQCKLVHHYHQKDCTEQHMLLAYSLTKVRPAVREEPLIEPWEAQQAEQECQEQARDVQLKYRSGNDEADEKY